nr:HXXEE domain-containing protein [uncultured Clostridium sp.]
MDFKKINKLWQLAGGGLLAPAILVLMICWLVTDPALDKYQWLLLLHLPILMIHEYEEYILPGGFKEFLNSKSPLAPKVLKEDVPLSEPYLFFVNIIVLWLWIILGAVFAKSIPWVGFGPILLQILINNVTHTIAFQKKQKGYNPGLITTIVLLMPYNVFVIWYIIKYNVFTQIDWVYGIASGLIVPVLLFTITMTRNKLASKVN